MRRYVVGRGAFGISFDGLSNRAPALDPMSITCRPDEVSNNLTIDRDGEMLAGFNQFRRAGPIGDLSVYTWRQSSWHRHHG
jgi:hypothetical protein